MWKKVYLRLPEVKTYLACELCWLFLRISESLLLSLKSVCFLKVEHPQQQKEVLSGTNCRPIFYNLGWEEERDGVKVWTWRCGDAESKKGIAVSPLWRL